MTDPTPDRIAAIRRQRDPRTAMSFDEAVDILGMALRSVALQKHLDSARDLLGRSASLPGHGEWCAEYDRCR